MYGGGQKAVKFEEDLGSIKPRVNQTEGNKIEEALQFSNKYQYTTSPSTMESYNKRKEMDKQ